MAERETRPVLLSLLGDGLLLLCALMGLTGSFLSLYGGVTSGARDTVRPVLDTALDLCAAQTDFFYPLAGLFALLSLAAWSLPRFRWAAAGGLTLLLGAAAAARWGQLVQGAGLTVHLISARFAQRVDWGRVFDYDPGLDPGLTLPEEAAAVQLFLVFSLALLALILGWGVVRARRWWLALVFTLPPLLPGLLADLFPHWTPFMALCACWCVMLLCDLCKWAPPRGRGRLVLVMMVCVSIMLATITLAFPRDGYTRPQWALGLEAGLQRSGEDLSLFLSRWDGPFGAPVTYVGDSGEADLTSAGPLNYIGRTVLRVKSDYRGRLYLRGSSLAVYEDGVWKALPEGTWQEYLDQVDGQEALPMLLPAFLAAGGKEYTVTVNNVGAVGTCVYTPYFLPGQAWDELGMLPVEDSYFARRQGQQEHTMLFRSASPGQEGTSLEEFLAQPLAAYREYVYDHYLDVPEELRDCLSQFCADYDIYGVDQEGPGDPLPVAQRAATALNWLCTYDQSAEPPPEGVDPVLYFLTESRRGYCMHYAAAAALMLRSLGIPARYVSGFTVESVPDREVTVPDRAAHAWVEVWVNGFGWYPVEVTPAAAFDWYQQGEVPPEDLPSGSVEESGEPEPTPTPSLGPDPSQQPSAAAGESGGPGDGPDLTVLFTVLKALAVLTGTAVLMWLGQFLVKRRRAARLSGPDRNRAALYAYGCLRRMERWGGRVDAEAVELAEKARFSQHVLTREELARLRGFVDRERERLCVVLGPLPRLAFRYFWGMPLRPKTGENPENDRENGA